MLIITILIRRPMLARGTTTVRHSPFLCSTRLLPPVNLSFLTVLKQWDPLSNSPGAQGSLPTCLFPPSWFLPPTAQDAPDYPLRPSSQDPKGGYRAPRGLKSAPRAIPTLFFRLQESPRAIQEASKRLSEGFRVEDAIRISFWTYFCLPKERA